MVKWKSIPSPGSIRNRCLVRLLKTRSSLCSAKGSPWRPTHLGIEIQNKNGKKMDSTRNWKLLQFSKVFPSPWPFSIFSMFNRNFTKKNKQWCHSTNCSLESWYGTGGVWLLAMASRQDQIAKISFQAKMMNTTKDDWNYWSNLVLLDGSFMKFGCIGMASPNHQAAQLLKKVPIDSNLEMLQSKWHLFSTWGHQPSPAISTRLRCWWWRSQE